MQFIKLRVYLARAHWQIKKFALHLLDEWRTCQELLSVPEQEFLKRYADLKEAHFESTILSSVPAPFNVMGGPEMGQSVQYACVLSVCDSSRLITRRSQ